MELQSTMFIFAEGKGDGQVHISSGKINACEFSGGEYISVV